MKQKTYLAEELRLFERLNGMLPSNLVADTSSLQGQMAKNILPTLTADQLNKLNTEIKKKGDNEVSLLFYRVSEGSSEAPQEATSFDINDLDNVKEYRFNGNTAPLLINDDVIEHYISVTLVMKA